ncbi:hypothetical protein A3D05_05230 [Candidatus Gottesmanbacteria bacterium RIFCSPHIGHO2_02_FULL_40_24]|uniref:Triosephosphate isomerase n=1 Tax=Candidatus Gottesmanbacteria bacterium RIFCSPHIGHO2_01_FULL_40_15 TaxID=1798376 RepID=A0A1F5Z7K2_9BACT|nr:MAG: hypothetical protein A2777_01865 [Candidatus Gottesmanbacteria bacterium RIFCSPHIGHO2_01_FULL_40_15]OGG16434.1 MAG: hypothetical protein A3D05_05230 [Candidatus Gottesmanbacteria bacterium RIFCSPHIGHO2_02_FULL_40_24]OGG22716.1 MAG: hypothetical protein A3B48_02860 [Candidatus Gottesmanbacteria bacterium RIFCSPLOWO2_01_FULL_40_10]OGG25548.1 MAG: hypothetical protein A3E42_04380 [Candidatus Gottesmanbacteria bacterium RIFCSPHIGHO2_12_FULL_40_13]
MSAAEKYLIGNWKSNKNSTDVAGFLKIFAHKCKNIKKIPLKIPKIVICPSYIHLPLSRDLIKKYNLPVELGAQNISPYGEGAFTGEVSASQLKEYVRYVIIGHSERRSNFAENEKILADKAKNALTNGLKVIYCVPDSKIPVPDGVAVIAYEPVFAIGTGKPDTPENANRTIGVIKKNYINTPVIYGGSVTSENIKSFMEKEYIDGVLPGKSSLDPISFYKMLINAAG